MVHVVQVVIDASGLLNQSEVEVVGVAVLTSVNGVSSLLGVAIADLLDVKVIAHASQIVFNLSALGGLH